MNDISLYQKHFSEFLRRYVENIRKLLTNPGNFFRQQIDENGLLEPTIFIAFTILIPHLFYAFLLAPFTLGLSVFVFIPAVFTNVAWFFLLAIILYGIVFCVESRGDFDVIYRSTAYSGVAYYFWLFPLPFINLLLFTVSFCILLFIAIRETHELSSGKTLLILLFPAFLILFTGGILTYGIMRWVVMGLLLG